MSKEIEIINRLAEIIGASSSEIILHYQWWFIVSSLSWLIVGVIIFMLGIRWKLTEDDWVDQDYLVIYRFFKGVVIFTGLMMIASNLGDLLAPHAAAIHQLISDIRD